MTFPLGAYIDDHAGVPHNLGQSGMIGSLASTPRALRRLPTPDPERLREILARRVGVRPAELFLTHGASEGNAIVLHFLATTLRRELGRAPRLRVGAPEYPPIPDTGVAAGLELAPAGGAADVAALSAPRNPNGTAVGAEELAELREGTRAVLIDETFREFTEHRSLLRAGRAGTWATGTFTKAFGADAIRVGYVVAPPESARAFYAYHALVLDRVALHSVSAALALLRDARTILAESRTLLAENSRVLHEGIPEASELAAPVWLDPSVGDGDAFARRAVRAGVLVCPGRFFGVRTGVRVGLTRRTFPEDFAAYLAVRRRVVRSSAR
jgi:histidinol-phosphate/aromatic aminotransferase/cobyric acid decarboxylase-like protein